MPKIIAIIPRGSHTSSILTRIFTFSQSGSNKASIEPEINPIIAAPKTRFIGSNTFGSHPINDEKNTKLNLKYKILAEKECSRVVFGGRLGQYKYYDMDEVIVKALECAQEIIK